VVGAVDGFDAVGGTTATGANEWQSNATPTTSPTRCCAMTTGPD